MPAPLFTAIEVHLLCKEQLRKLFATVDSGSFHADDGREIFFHCSSLQQIDFDALKEGEKVEFDVERGEKGPRAVRVQASRPELTAL